MPVDELVVLIERLLSGGFCSPDSQIYFLSRDGCQLRTVGNITFHHADRSLDLFRGDDGVTADLREVIEVLRAANWEKPGPVRIQPDGHGKANLMPLHHVSLASEIHGAECEIHDSDLVLCP